MIRLAVSEGSDQTARMRRLIWAFAVRICPKISFHKARPIYISEILKLSIRTDELLYKECEYSDITEVQVD